MMTNTFRTTRRVHEKTGQSTREDRVPIMRLESRGGGFTQHNFVVSKYANMNGKPVESFIGKVSELTTGPATATGVLKFYRFCFEHLSVLFKPKSHIKNRYEFSNLVQGVWVFTMSKGTSALCVSADGKHDALLDSECFLVFRLQVQAFIALASVFGRRWVFPK